MTAQAVREAPYSRALAAEPGLKAVESLVDALCRLVRPEDTFCAGCAWERIVKPLLVPLVGWGREALLEQAADPSGEDVTAEWIGPQREVAPPATTETEKWLRSSAAYDAVTDAWIAQLEKADPGNGHGIARGRQSVQ